MVDHHILLLTVQWEYHSECMVVNKSDVNNLNQFVTMFKLINNKNLGTTFTVYMNVFYFFSHHALRSAMIKYPNDNILDISKNVLSNSCLTFKEKAVTCLVIATHYLFRAYYFSRKTARITFEKLGIDKTYYRFRTSYLKLFRILKK